MAAVALIMLVVAFGRGREVPVAGLTAAWHTLWRDLASIGFVFVQQYLPELLPFLRYLIPYNLGMPFGNGVAPSIAAAWMTGVTPTSVLPFISALVASVLFFAVALVVFQRQEL